MPSLRSHHCAMMGRPVDGTAGAVTNSLRGAPANLVEVHFAAKCLIRVSQVRLRAIWRLTDGTTQPRELRESQK